MQFIKPETGTVDVMVLDHEGHCLADGPALIDYEKMSGEIWPTNPIEKIEKARFLYVSDPPLGPAQIRLKSILGPSPMSPPRYWFNLVS